MRKHFKNKHLIRVLTIIIAVLTLSICLKPYPPYKSIPIQMVDEIDADFSFAENWNYDWGVYENQYGQLSCDGLCPNEAYEMQVDGRIIEDSIKAYYELIDTTHFHHTMQSKAEMYEWTGCDYIYVSRDSNMRISAETVITPGSHSTLHFQINRDKAKIWAHYNSIANVQPRNFSLKSGFIKVERQAFERDTIKAQFDLTFSNTLESDVALSWSGLIYAAID